jgi:hypothetical protein
MNAYDVLQGSGSHYIQTDSDLRTESENYPVDIDAVAQLARLYAAGTPPDEEFRSIKERINATSNELPNNQSDAHLRPTEWRTPQEIRSSAVAYNRQTTDAAFNQRIETIRETLEFSAELRVLESSIRVVPRPSGFENQFMSAKSLMRGRIFHVAFFSFAAVIGLAFCWHSQEAKEIVSRWALSMDRLLSVSTRESAPALATSSELLRGRALPELIAARPSANRFDPQQERIYADSATTHRVKQKTKLKTSSPHRTLR